MHEEKAPEDVLHEYDGIQECNNHLPRWWLWTLYLAIIFGFAYWLFFHSFGQGRLPSMAYQDVKLERMAKEAESLKSAGQVDDALLAKLSKEPTSVIEGKAIFEQTCVTCHDADGRGKIGPNLTDDAWIHGSQPMDVYKIVKDGFLPKQMPAWGLQLGERKVRTVVAYVLSLRNTNVAGGKAPQGQPASAP